MENNIIYHFGIKGMKRGVRRYQNSDGTRTSAGKKRHYKKADREIDEAMYGKRGVKRIEKRMNKGRSHFTASSIEMGRKAVTDVMIATAATTAIFDVQTGGAVHKAIGSMAANAIRKKAAQKGMQRANSALAKIGTYQYKKVAGNVYQRVMK